MQPTLEALQALIDADGLDIGQIPVDTLVELTCEDGQIPVLVVDPQGGMMVLVGEQLGQTEPVIANMLGTGLTPGGSILQIGVMKVGGVLRVKSLKPRGFIETSLVLAAKLVDATTAASRPEAIAMHTAYQAWKAKKPQKNPPQDREAVMKEALALFPEEFRSWIEAFIKDFSQDGVLSVLGVLYSAQKQDKMQAAKDRLVREFDEHWYYQHPKIRGAFMSAKDAARLQAIYTELELPLPNQP